MLVLSRRAGEKIKLGDNIVVTVLGVEGSVVKLGIEAPREVTILRLEVLEQIKKENIDAAAKDVTDIAEAVDLLKKKLSGEKKD